MKNITQLKYEKENKVSELIKKCGMFFAFSNDQFAKNKTPKSPDEKYISLGIGAYMPKSKFEVYKSGVAEIELWFENEISKNNLRQEYILDELNNHEAFYTGELEPTMDALGPTYTRNEIVAVYNQNC